jgi:Flp pilus assembly protein TadG
VIFSGNTIRSEFSTLRSSLFRDYRGSQVVELAISLPILAVIAIGIAQFSGAYNLKQILNNAAREGARTAASQYSDYGTLSNCMSGSCVAAAAESVSNYLQNAGVSPVCTFDTAGTAVGTFAWQFTSTSSGCGSAVLLIEQGVPIGSGPVVKSVRVTLTYPSRFSMGSLFNMLSPGSSTTMPSTLTSNAIMPDLMN